MKHALKFSSGVILSFCSFCLMAIVPYTIPLGLIGFVGASKLIYDGLCQNDIKNSCFIVEKNRDIYLKNEKYKITNITQNYFHFNFSKKNNKDYFVLQALNLFQQLPQIENDETILYGCQSQAFVKRLLQILERQGYITNFKSVESDYKSNLGIERFLLGVKSSKKKITMYDMIFELTDKKLDASEVPNILKQFGINYLDYSTKIDEHNRMIFFDKKTETEEKIEASSFVIESKGDVVSNHDEINTNDNTTISHIESLKKLRNEVISEYYVSESYENNNDDIKKNK